MYSNNSEKEIKLQTINNVLKFWEVFNFHRHKLKSGSSGVLKTFASSVEFHVDQGNYTHALRESVELLKKVSELIEEPSLNEDDC